MNDDRRLRRYVQAMVGLGVVLLLVNGFIGAALLFGRPPDRATLTVLAVSGLVIGMGLLVAGNHAWHRARLYGRTTRRSPWGDM